MGVPLIQAYRVGRYIAGRRLRGVKRYPLVLMLEPLFQCNLACAGCGKIDYPKEILKKRLAVADALRAVDTPPIEIVIEPDDREPINGSDTVFAAVAAAAWRAERHPSEWPTRRR